MSDVKRYDVTHDGEGEYLEMPCCDGKWVKFEDHAAKLRDVERERDQLRVEVEDWKNAGAIEEDEFQDICASENITPSDCCKPKYCRLAPFHEIKLLRAQLARMSAPVSDEEWACATYRQGVSTGVMGTEDEKPVMHWTQMTSRDLLNALLASRAEAPKEPA